MKKIHQNLTKAWKIGASSLKIEPPKNLQDWAEENYYLAPISSSVAGPWKTQPWQIGLFQILENFNIEQVSIIAAAQIGKTKVITAFALWNTIHKKRNAIIYQPLKETAGVYSTEEVASLFEYSPLMRESLSTDYRIQSGINSPFKKVFDGVQILFKGGSTSISYRGITTSTVILDDLDGFPRNVNNEGSPTLLAKMRVKSAINPKVVLCSTPSAKGGYSLIDEAHSSSELKLQRYLPCLHCGESYVLDRSVLTMDEKTVRATGTITCPHCGEIETYNRFQQMDALGEWQSEDGITLNEKTAKLYDESGLEVNFPRTIGISITTLYSYFSGWETTARTYNEALSALEKDDNDSLLRTFFNTQMGEVYVERGEENSPITLKEKSLDYGLNTLPKDTILLTLGIDYGDTRIHYVATAFTKDSKAYVVDYHEFKAKKRGALADPTHIVWDSLRGVIQAGIAGMPFSLVYMDAGYRKQLIYDFAKSFEDNEVTPSFGLQHAPPIKRNKAKPHSGNIQTVSIGTHYIKQQVQVSLKLREQADRSINISRDSSDAFVKALTSESLTEKNGKPYWEKLHSENHYFDALCYSIAAGHELGVYNKRILKTVDEKITISQDGEVLEKAPLVKAKTHTLKKRPRRRQSKSNH